MQADKKFHVLFFFASDCPLCQNYIPMVHYLERYTDSHPSIGFTVIREESPDSLPVANASDFMFSKNEIFDQEKEIANQCKATITPEVVVLDSMGNKIYQGAIDNWSYETGKHRPFATEHYVKDILRGLLSGKEDAHPNHPAVGCFIE